MGNLQRWRAAPKAEPGIAWSQGEPGLHPTCTEDAVRPQQEGTRGAGGTNLSLSCPRPHLEWVAGRGSATVERTRGWKTERSRDSAAPRLLSPHSAGLSHPRNRRDTPPRAVLHLPLPSRPAITARSPPSLRIQSFRLTICTWD
ncbi:uncharacterized protein LOC128928458 [Callithrix jacchus]